MIEQPFHLEEVGRLTGLLLEGALGPDDRLRLEDTLLADPAALEYYQDYVDVHCLLHWQHGLPEEPAASGIGRGAGSQRRGMVGSPTIGVSVGAAVELPHQPGNETPGPEPLVPPIVLDLSPTSHYPLSTSHSFVGGPVFSYMAATVILGVMLLGAWAYKITHYNQIAEAPPPSVAAGDRPELVFVGRISGMVDCRWADPSTEAYAGASVPLGRKYALASGLMQITYDSGAKVILEGPCTYEAESHAGGYLALGKLTARVVSGQWPVASAKPQAANQKSALRPPPSAFIVRTPTAVVTDLGTEFGVEVSAEGNTTSHVFRGSVKVQVVVSEKGTGPICRNGPEAGTDAQRWSSHKLDLSPFPTQGVVLRANESARVEKSKGAGSPRLVLSGEVGNPPKFARRLVEPPKLLDLLDVVAGGRGTGNLRERGIDPVTGMEDPLFLAHYRGGDRQYWLVGWHRLIDGVFVPDGSDGAVQLNSAGDAFEGFPETSGEVYGSIWSRAVDIGSKRVTTTQPWVYSMIREKQFMPEGRGLLGFYANGGISFDLGAMRKMYPEARPSRFRATAGLADGPRKDPESFGMADVWVFVDGGLKLKREKLRVRDGTFQVDVELGPRDRFLTLAATDGGNGISWDSVVFGDPILHMSSTESENRKEGRSMEQ